jgi:hypothetical protein
MGHLTRPSSTMAARAALAPLRRAAAALKPAGTRAMSGGSFEHEFGAFAHAQAQRKPFPCQSALTP